MLGWNDYIIKSDGFYPDLFEIPETTVNELANFVMNKVSNNIFKESSNQRSVKGTDLFPHIDDVVVSGRYILPDSKIVHNISRIVPFALMVAGNEVGNKKSQG